MVLGPSCLVLLIHKNGRDLAGKQGVDVGPDLVGLCPREGVKDAPAPGRETGGELSTRGVCGPEDRGICRQVGHWQGTAMAFWVTGEMP